MANYKLKFVSFNDADTPIVLQNENGPCPLIAVANVLILRGQLRLPSQATDVPQDRLMSLVAEHLLDTNLGVDDALRYAADLRQNLQDVISVLPKMATGVDVNPNFESIRGFEFTNEIAIFDLMNISLVHGWLADPQDERYVTVLHGQSYNQIVSRLVAIMGEEAPRHLLTPQSSFGSAAGSARQGTVASTRSASTELEQKHALVGGGSDEVTRTTCSGTQDDNRASEDGHVEAQGHLQSLEDIPRDRRIPDGVVNDDDQAVDVVEQVVKNIFSSVVAASSSSSHGGTQTSLFVGGFSLDCFEEGFGSAAPPSTGGAVQGNTVQSQPNRNIKSTEEAEKAAKDVEFSKTAQEFLEAASSQLTVYGLQQLHEGLNNRELAVFFRNNHFNTLYKHNGKLYILVTDQGYISEKGVVWERLDAVDGDTHFFTSDFLPYTKVEPVLDASEEDVALQRALVESVSANQGAVGTGHMGSLPPDFLAIPERSGQDQGPEQQQQQQQHASILQANEDIDYALALQLHEEMLQEQERQRNEERQQQQEVGRRATSAAAQEGVQTPYGVARTHQGAADQHGMPCTGSHISRYHTQGRILPSSGGMAQRQQQGNMAHPGFLAARQDGRGRQQQEQNELTVFQKTWSSIRSFFKHQ